jgi:hypothetical protein
LSRLRKIRLGKMPVQSVPAPLVVSDGGEKTPTSGALAAAFHLSKAEVEWFDRKPSLFSSWHRVGEASLKVSVYTDRKGSVCGVSFGRLLGKATVPLDLNGAEAKPAVLHSSSKAKLKLLNLSFSAALSAPDEPIVCGSPSSLKQANTLVHDDRRYPVEYCLI